MADETDLLRLKQMSGKSWRELEIETGIPASTIRNHVGGRVNPNPDIVAALVEAMTEVKPTETVPASTMNVSCEMYERQIAHLKQELAEAKRYLRGLSIALAVVLALLLGVMVFDLLHRNVGWIRASFFILPLKGLIL